MEAYKLITEVKDRNLQVILPEGFRDEKVEVIVLKIRDIEQGKNKKPSDYWNLISKKSGEDLLNKVEESKSEWERNI